MNISNLTTNILTHTAITALKNAYDQCGDTAAKESIIYALKAIIQLHYDLGKHAVHGGISESDCDCDCDCDCDPSEYCAAV
jgi:hypothetical protein